MESIALIDLSMSVTAFCAMRFAKASVSRRTSKKEPTQ